MAFSLSAGVNIVEKDATNIIPAVSSSTGAFAGAYAWGPVMSPVLVSSENDLVSIFGKPNKFNYVSFFSAANFLSYASSLLVNRVDTGATNACAEPSGTVDSVTITAQTSAYKPGYTATFSASPNGVTATATLTMAPTSIATVAVGPGGGGTGYVDGAAVSATGGVGFVATATVVGGAVTAIVVTNGGSGFTTQPVITVAGGVGGEFIADLTPTTIASVNMVLHGDGYISAPTLTIKDTVGATVTAPTATVNTTFGGVVGLWNKDTHDSMFAGNVRTYGEFAAKYPGTLGNALKVGICDSGNYATWDYRAEFDAAPATSDFAAGVSGSNDEVHAIVIDSTGAITGTPGAILEKYSFLSKASDAKLADGTNNYYMDVINERSKYIWVLAQPAVADVTGTMNWGTSATTTAFGVLNVPFIYQLSSAVDGATNQEYAIVDAKQQNAYALFANAELYSPSLIFMGKASTTSIKYVSDNVTDVRKDCMLFFSPSDVGGPIIGNDSAAAEKAVTFRTTTNLNTSYAVMDSGWKYQYDRYNDKFWWVPLNADVAGLCARTDATNDPWFSPGGFNRGQIKNVVKLGMNPDQTSRDLLYKNGVNPVVSFPGQGVVLYGDKTQQSKPSAFDRINVRRLFIILEKAISLAAKYQLFELNDEFTRAQFKSMVEPFLRDVQGRRGLTEFAVICDTSVNTPEVIDRNEFAATLLIKPSRSINFINLTFVAARTGVSFTELGA